MGIREAGYRGVEQFLQLCLTLRDLLRLNRDRVGRKERMANTVRADFDQIALGECVQLVNPECTPAVTQFRNRTGPCRKRVHRGASLAVVKGLQCLPDRIIQVVPGTWFSFPGFLLKFKTIVLSEARRTSQLPMKDFWAKRQLKGVRQVFRSKQHLLQLVPPEFSLASDITGCEEDSCRHLKV